MNEVSQPIKKSILQKPTTQTTFHIDFDWWTENDPNWRTSLLGYLCENHRTFYEGTDTNANVDSIDSETAEVTQVDQLLAFLYDHCSQQDQFILDNGAVTDSVFRIFLKNHNTPMRIIDIADAIGRPADTILRTLTNGRIIKGIKPTLN